jgi:RNA ligase
MITKDILMQYVDNGLIDFQTHENLDLAIYNYTPKTQYEKLWDNVTLTCRGLVMSGDVIVARPFPKFFNFSEHKPEEIPNLPFEVFEKMDGSAGILFYYSGDWHLATRGSFKSEQAIRGKAMLDSLNLYHKLDPAYTYMFEIIYENNVIVCRYDFEDMVLIGVIRTSDGYEMPYSEWPKGFRTVEKHNNKNLKELLNTSAIGSNREGYVVRFSNGFRIKIKGDEYVRLHRILTNVSTLTIWEYLKDGLPFDEILNNVPDEFYDSVRKVKEDLLTQYSYIETGALAAFESLRDCPDRKTFANLANTDFANCASLLFSMLDGKDYSGKIWNMIRPDFEKLSF